MIDVSDSFGSLHNKTLSDAEYGKTKHPFLRKGGGGLFGLPRSNRQPFRQLRAEIFRYLRSFSIVVIGFGMLVWSIYFCSELWKRLFL